MIDAGLLADLPENQCVAIADGRAIVARVGPGAVAFANECLHQASPLEGGLITNETLVCPLHFWRYDLPAGKHVGTGAPLPSYPVTIEDGRVWVDVPEPPRPRSMREQLLDHAAEWKRE